MFNYRFLIETHECNTKSKLLKTLRIVERDYNYDKDKK